MGRRDQASRLAGIDGQWFAGNAADSPCRATSLLPSQSHSDRRQRVSPRIARRIPHLDGLAVIEHPVGRPSRAQLTGKRSALLISRVVRTCPLGRTASVAIALQAGLG